MADVERRTVLGVGFAIVTSALPSATAAASGDTISPTAPGAPEDLSLASSDFPEEDGFYTITGSWAAPADDGGSPLTAYRYRLYRRVGSTWSQVSGSEVSASTTSTAFAASTGEYQLQVEAANAVGWSASASGTVTVPPDVLVPAPPA